MRLKGKGEGEKATPEAPRPQRASTAVPSIVSPEMAVTGNLVSTGEIQVDGHVDGDVQAETLTIGEKGRINGTVRASHLRVLGHVDGEIQADNVTVLASARVNGDVVHESLAIEAGAMIEGHCRRKETGTAAHGASPAKGANGGNRTHGAGSVTNGQAENTWLPDGQDTAKPS